MILNPNDRLDLPSASALEQMSLCPGSWNAQIGKPDLPKDENDVSNVGTRVHEALQFLTGADALVNPRERWLYSACHRGEMSIVDMLMPLDGVEAQETPVRVRETEIRLGIVDPKSNLLTATGRFDTRYRTKNVSLILDYKTGPIPVTRASENPQMAALAVAEAQDISPDEIYCAIIQPTEPEPLSMVRYSATTIAEAQQFVLDILDAAMSHGAPRVAGAKQCRYCKASGECPEALELALSAKPEHVEVQKVKRSYEVLNLAMLSGQQLAEARPKLKFMEKISEAVDQEIKTRLAADPHSVPGFYLKPTTQWRVSDFLRGMALVRCSIMEFIDASEFGKSDLRLAFNLKNGLANSSKAKEKEFEELIAPVIEKMPGTPRLTEGSSTEFSLEE